MLLTAESLNDKSATHVKASASECQLATWFKPSAGFLPGITLSPLPEL